MMLAVALLIAASACDRFRPGTKSPAATGAVPQIKATVVTIRTTLQPENRTIEHRLVIANDLARMSDELDQWRLYDLKSGRVIFVDEIAQTRRSEPLASLIAERAGLHARPLPTGVPRPTVSKGTETRQLAGVSATSISIKAGSYLRQLWIGRPAAIHPELFRMMVASDLPTSTLAPMMAAVDTALLAARGYPLIDRTEFTYGEKNVVVERSVVKIETDSVPKTFLEIPENFREMTAKPATMGGTESRARRTE